MRRVLVLFLALTGCDSVVSDVTIDHPRRVAVVETRNTLKVSSLGRVPARAWPDPSDPSIVVVHAADPHTQRSVALAFRRATGRASIVRDRTGFALHPRCRTRGLYSLRDAGQARVWVDEDRDGRLQGTFDLVVTRDSDPTQRLELRDGAFDVVLQPSASATCWDDSAGA